MFPVTDVDHETLESAIGFDSTFSLTWGLWCDRNTGDHCGILTNWKLVDHFVLPLCFADPASNHRITFIEIIFAALFCCIMRPRYLFFFLFWHVFLLRYVSFIYNWHFSICKLPASCFFMKCFYTPTHPSRFRNPRPCQEQVCGYVSEQVLPHALNGEHICPSALLPLGWAWLVSSNMVCMWDYHAFFQCSLSHNKFSDMFWRQIEWSCLKDVLEGRPYPPFFRMLHHDSSESSG